jgi:predicted AAA+ superfamily ATPase
MYKEGCNMDIVMINLTALLEDQNPWWLEPRRRRAVRYPVRRSLQAQVRDHVLRQGERRALVLEGPRQVGKTVLLLQVIDDLLESGWPAGNITYFDFSDDRVAGALSPRQVVDAKPASCDERLPRAFLFDEIGRAERWAEWLKQAVDHSSYRLVATDSASTLLRSGSRESGQGRWDLLRLEGLGFAEFARIARPDSASALDALRAFPALFERYLARGGYPEHVMTDDVTDVRARVRADIVDRAISRDLRLLYDDPRVKDLFVYLVQRSGGLFDARKRAQDLNADYRSLEAWRTALEDTMLLTSLSPYTVSSKARSRLSSKPKLYAADHGLIVAFSELPDPLGDTETRGRVFEALVFHHLRQLADEQRAKLTYLRHDAGEVDFVFESRSTRTAIEVTSSQNAASKVGSLQVVAKEAKANRLLVIHGGLTTDRRGDVDLVPAPLFAVDPAAAVLGGA